VPIKQIILVSNEDTYQSRVEAVREAFTNHFTPSSVIETTGLNFAEALPFVNKMTMDLFTHALSRCQQGETISIPGKPHITPLAMELSDISDEQWRATRREDLIIIALDCIDRVSRLKLS